MDLANKRHINMKGCTLKEIEFAPEGMPPEIHSPIIFVRFWSGLVLGYAGVTLDDWHDFRDSKHPGPHWARHMCGKFHLLLVERPGNSEPIEISKRKRFAARDYAEEEEKAG